MMQSSKNKGFTASDIERYHSGKMPETERHAIEKAALDDPFLADALEGYAYTATPAEDLQKIRSRLQEKLEENRRVVPLFSPRRQWLRAAAAVIVLAGAGWLAYNGFSGPRDEIAAKQPSEASKSPAPLSAPANTDTAGNLQNGIGTSSDSYSLSRPVTGKHHWTDQEAAKDKFVQPESKTYTAVSDSLTLHNNVTVSATAPPIQTEELSRPNDTRTYNNTRNDVSNMRTDPSANRAGMPSERQNNIAANRQQAEAFKPYRDSFSQDDNMAMRRKANLSGKSDTIKNFDVVLKPIDLPENEVVVLSEGRKKEVARVPRVIIDTLEPAEGLARFDDYVASNLKTPDELKLNQQSGEVQLSFDVNRNGQPVNITVVKSLCDKCDEEAIRLLKEGPKWKKKKNKKGKITIKF